LPTLTAYKYTSPPGKVSRATIAVVFAALLMPGGTLLAQQVSDSTVGLRLRLTNDSLRFEVPIALRPGGRLGPRVPPEATGVAWLLETGNVVRSLRSARWREVVLASLSPAPEEPHLEIPRPEAIAEQAPEVTEEQAALETLAEFADLGLDMTARIEMSFDQLKNARCTSADAFGAASGCVSGFPTPTLDEQFNVRAGGVVGDRVHLNVDFDTEREFNANNAITVYYQGLEDEILRRVDVGTVTFEAPASRFITSGIPSNSFGVQAEAQLGPLNLRSILAQQKGSTVRTRYFTVGDAATHPVDFGARDLDFEAGRFFFVVDPVGVPGYPEIDVLTLRREDLPLTLQTAEVRVYRLRAQGGQVEENTNLGGINAIALRGDSPQRVGPFSWELLVEGEHYYLDPSGAWFGLSTSVGTEDFLAVSYVTVAGDTVGTFPAVNTDVDTLELVYEPRRGPEVPTFGYEMRNAYRVGRGNIQRTTASLAILVNDSEKPLDGEGTYLSRLGLALSTDASTLDEFNRVFPRERDPNGGAPIRDLFVIFPHLTPFADTARLLPGERNDSLYRTPTYLRRTQGPPPKFDLQMHYEGGGSGDRSTLNLGAIQVRLGSERIYIGERQLARGRDYEMDYALGQVTFLNPDSLFVGPTQVRAEFEENQLFDDAPRSILGFSGTYELGSAGNVSAIGIFQRERTVSTRPLLGLEPEALFVGGLSADLHFRPNGVTRFLDGLPLLSTSVPSALDMNGEVAFSDPNSNRTGTAYLEDFEQQQSTRISLAERNFQMSSAPSSGLGLPGSHLGRSGDFDPSDAVSVVWQNLIPSSTGLVQFSPQEIDSTIVLTGTGVAVETVLWLTLKPDTVGGAPDPTTGDPRWFRPHSPGPRWRSMTQPLGGGAGVGVDLSRVEFLEFWVLEDQARSAVAQDAYLVFDFGTVFEDAVDFGPLSFDPVGADTTFDGFQFAGPTRLDSEKDPVTNVFNAQFDDLGIRGDLLDSIVNEETGAVLRRFPMCDLRGITNATAFPLGSLLARCSRGNGFLNTEDLDGDNRLDVAVGAVQEDFVRYVFPFGADEFFVREGGTYVDDSGGLYKWRLYRVPFREDTVQVGNPRLRQIESLRMTVVAPDQAGPEEEFSVSLARMQFVGAPWIKRAETPITGLSGGTGVGRGEVVASVVTTENTDLGYESPPGIRDQPQRADLEFGFGSQQINETSLRLLASDIRGGERAEALLRFTVSADKNFLKYRNLRVWARGRGPGWEEGDLEFFIKVGRDENNFYMYRTPARSLSWEPEVVVELDKWMDLRTEVETAWLSGQPPSGALECGGDSTAYVACDGRYFVQVRDPGTAPPNLARVSEIAVGMYRQLESVVIDQAELWTDDIRLTDVIDESGAAAALDLRLAAADVVELVFGYNGVNDQFRQLGEDPRYLTDRAYRFAGVLNVDKFMPERWGLSMPLRVEHVKTDVDQFFITGTDLMADALDGVRQPRSSVTDVELALRRVRRGTSWVERALLDPVAFRARRTSGETVNSLNSANSKHQQVHGDYLSTPRPLSFKAVPSFVTDLIDMLPGFLSNSEFAEGLRSSRLRWNPQRLRLSSTLNDNTTGRTTFRVPVAVGPDTLLRPLLSITHLWRNAVELDFRPFSTFGLRAAYTSTRDLQDYGDTTSVGRYLQDRGGEFLGMDAGFERARRVTAGMDIAPVLNEWLRPRFVFTSTYNFNRDPNAAGPVQTDPDSGSVRTPENMSNARMREFGAILDVARLTSGVFGDSTVMADLTRGLLPADITYVRELRSRFNDIVFDPDLTYRLALGPLDEFREQEGFLAASSGETVGLTASAGARLPLGGQFRLSYRNDRSTVWFLRTEGQQRSEQSTEEWPSLTASWVYTPSSVLRRLVSSLSAQFRWRVIERESIRPRLDPVGEPDGFEEDLLTEDDATVISPALTLVLPGGLTASGSYTMTDGRRVTSGNTTNTDQSDWTAALGFGFRPPQSVIRTRSQIRTSLRFNSSKRVVCLIPLGDDECRTVSDSRRQQIDMQMDTGLSDTLRGGAIFSYVLNDLRHTSDRLSQYTFRVFLDLRLFAGEIR
jgi:hypothetical protein